MHRKQGRLAEKAIIELSKIAPDMIKLLKSLLDSNDPNSKTSYYIKEMERIFVDIKEIK